MKLRKIQADCVGKDDEETNCSIDRSYCSRKTELSIQLAKAIGGEIISADSMQVYKYMDVGSAKSHRKKWMVYIIIWWMN